MKPIVFITSNAHKADYLARWLDFPVVHKSIEIDELQSLDLKEVVEHKAKAAYQVIKEPVLVEDVALTFHGMGRLPGTLVKWFLEELQPAGLARFADALSDKRATASIMYGLYDGNTLQTFEAHVDGVIETTPHTDEDAGWNTAKSWNSIFRPNGSDKTYAEMTEEELRPVSHRAKAIALLRAYLKKLEAQQGLSSSSELDK